MAWRLALFFLFDSERSDQSPAGIGSAAAGGQAVEFTGRAISRAQSRTDRSERFERESGAVE